MNTITQSMSLPQELTTHSFLNPRLRNIKAQTPSKELSTYKFRKNFIFQPQLAFRQFWFLWSNDLPPSHAGQQAWFCKHPYCPYHHLYGD
jgi:hypothetical protein